MPGAERPAKRQRRSTVVLSDDEDEFVPNDLPVRTTRTQRQLELDRGDDATISLSPSKTRNTASKKVTKGKPAKASPKSTPPKARKSSKAKEPEKSKAINSFFGKVSEEQRWHRKSMTPEDVSDGEAGDAIEDDDSPGRGDDGDIKTTLDRRKLAPLNELNGSKASHSGPPSSTQRFIKPALPGKKPSTNLASKVVDQEETHPPWADRYGPGTLDELAIHKKKATDVRTWFEGALAGRDPRRLLVLKGPAGSGKTTTVNLLSKALGFSISHWQNPSFYDSASSGSVASQFDDFLNRGGNFGTLALGSMASTVDIGDPSVPTVLLVEEFPAGMARSSGMDQFRSVILQFLARSSPTTALPFQKQANVSTTPPMVMIISETLLSSSTAFSDSFTAHRLLGPVILNHPLTTVIEYNPVAPTFISKALELVIKKEAQESRRKRVPGSVVLQKLSEMGDIRNAISSLEFLCLRGDGNAEWSGTVAAKAKKSSKKPESMTDMERNSLQLISQRETTLDMFHATGKVVYNKREDPRIQNPNAEPPPRPPEHLMHLYSPKLSEVDIEALLNETGTDIQTFISTLHENHVLSCNGDSFVDCFEGCADILSVSDILNPESRRSIRSPGNNASVVQQSQNLGAFDALRQDEISFNVATRGLIFNLPYPVHRATPSSGRKQDSYKMWYPTSLRLWKTSEEIDALIDLHIRAELAGSDQKVKVKIEANTESVANWTVRANLSAFNDSERVIDDEEKMRRVIPPRQTLTLEMLPYVARIQRARRDESNTLNKITKLTGASVVPNDDEPSDDEAQEEVIIASKKISPGSRLVGGHASKAFASPSKIKKEVTHDEAEVDLFLEDDDIVDD
jgi:cell cycle checkpoint protein